jgi:hypothetical protein
MNTVLFFIYLFGINALLADGAKIMQVRFGAARNVLLIPTSHFGLTRRKKGQVLQNIER